MTKFGILGLVVGTVSYLALLHISNYYATFGTGCIPPGEPFLTCGPGLLKSYYFFFHGQRDSMFMFFVNVLFWGGVFSIIGVTYDKVKR